MITLITGTPGAGKTLYTVACVLPSFKDRTLYVDGIPDLLIDHEQPLGEVDDWKNWLPAGAVLVVDECQRIWRPRGSGSKVPPGVAAMETHRHTGNDIVLITQHPNLLDPNVRRLVGRHIHIRRLFGWSRAITYEWDSAQNPDRISTAIKRSFRYPKSAFQMYRSAEQHNKRGQRVPLVLVLGVAAVIAVPVAGWYAFSRTKERIAGPVQSEVVTDVTDPALVQKASTVVASAVSRPMRLQEALTLQDDHDHLSAPLYEAVKPPVIAPEVVGCIASRARCTCYSQQSTPIWMPPDQCQARAAGLYYDPYRNPPPLSVPENKQEQQDSF